MLGSIADAEYAVQETMLAAWQGIGGFTEQRASLRRHHADTLIVPMSLIRDAYRAQILGGLADGARRSCTSSWRRTPGRSGSGSTPRMPEPGGDWDQFAREVGMTSVDEIVAAAARQPGGTLLLRSDRLTPAELADEVLAAAGLSRVHADGKPMRQARPHGSKDT
jgi:hypothetical protein